MSVPAAPVTVSAVGQTFTIQGPIHPSAGQAWECRIDNSTQYALQVAVAGSNVTYVMPYGTLTVGGPGGPAEITLTAVSQAGATPSGSQLSQIFTTWAQSPDTIPVHIGVPGGGGTPLLNLLNFIVDSGQTLSVNSPTALVLAGTDLFGWLTDVGETLTFQLFEVDGTADTVGSFLSDSGATLAHN